MKKNNFLVNGYIKKLRKTLLQDKSKEILLLFEELLKKLKIRSI